MKVAGSLRPIGSAMTCPVATSSAATMEWGNAAPIQLELVTVGGEGGYRVPDRKYLHRVCICSA